MSNTVNLAEKFANSEKFQKLFEDGMNLVEESATYLDGNGRDAAKQLDRTAAMLYGSESMRLTTRLMQLASWLLLQRAANEGEMSREQLVEEKTKIKLNDTISKTENPAWQELPAEFVELVNRSLTLQNRVIGLDAELYGAQESKADRDTQNPVEQQLRLLSNALGATKN